MTDHNAEIVRAAERWFDERGSLIVHPRGAHDTTGTAEAIARAVAAKREAERPKLLTAEEALAIWYCTTCPDHHRRAEMAAVLTAAHDRVVRVIEALPSADGSSYLRSWDDIRRALGGQP